MAPGSTASCRWQLTITDACRMPRRTNTLPKSVCLTERLLAPCTRRSDRNWVSREAGVTAQIAHRHSAQADVAPVASDVLVVRGHRAALHVGQPSARPVGARTDRRCLAGCVGLGLSRVHPPRSPGGRAAGRRRHRLADGGDHDHDARWAALARHRLDRCPCAVADARGLEAGVRDERSDRRPDRRAVRR